MDHNDLLDRIFEDESCLTVLANKLLEERLADGKVSESITTNMLVAQSALYISRITLERACKKLDALENPVEPPAEKTPEEAKEETPQSVDEN